MGVVLPACVVFAQDFTGRIIDEVRFQGLERVSEQTVRARLEVQKGQTFNQKAIARDIRRLYETGFFASIEADASLENNQLVVTYIVEEKKFIDEVLILGCDKVKERHVRGALTWREGDTYAPEAFQDELNAIIRLYQSKGFPNARADIRVENVGPSRVRITYLIDEGNKARIRHISFDGNEVLSDRKLRRVMKTRRGWWFLGGKFDETVFEDDLKKIVDEYGNYGRLEALVTGTDINYDEKGKGMNIRVLVSEGPEYSVESLDIADNVVFDDDEITRAVKVTPGSVHNKGQVAADSKTIQQGYEDSGYINAQVTPQVTLDREKKTTHVVHRISEGDLKYIREIKITGNTVTRDEVIRREILSIPGERFDGGLIRASQSRLEGTDYFDQTRFTIENVEDSDSFANLLVDVDEGKTGYFNFGAGYSTEERFGGYAELRLDNFDITNWPKFTGGGQQFRLRLHLGERRDQYSLSFTDPEIGGLPLAFGFDVFSESYEYRGGADYTEEETGAQLRVGKILSPYVSLRGMLRYSDTKITGLPWFAWITYPPDYWREREAETTISTVWGITRNTLDSKRDPARGAVHDLQLELAGFGGDNNFYKVEHSSAWYWTLDRNEKTVLMFRTREGWVNEYGSSDYVSLDERFFAGGTTTVRGYDNRDIGPKERGLFGFGESQAVGGKLRLIENLELKYKMTKQLRFYAFVDAGGVWRDSGDFDLGDMKYGAGLGIGFDVPRMGPIRLDYGIPLNPDDDQGSGRLHLQTALRF